MEILGPTPKCGETCHNLIHFEDEERISDPEICKEIPDYMLS